VSKREGARSHHFARHMPGTGHVRGARRMALEAAVRSCVTIPVRRRRARQDYASSLRCVCRPACYRRIPIKQFYSQASALRNTARSRDARDPSAPPPRRPEPGCSARAISPTPLGRTARSHGHCSASGNRDRRLNASPGLDFRRREDPARPWHGQCTTRCHDVRQRPATVASRTGRGAWRRGA